jgi:hypothetical protein
MQIEITLTRHADHVEVSTPLSFTATKRFRFGGNHGIRQANAENDALMYAHGLEAGIRAIVHHMNSISCRTTWKHNDEQEA